MVLCPNCATALDLSQKQIECFGCERRFPRLGGTKGIPVIFRNPEKYLHSCRAQVALLEQQIERTVQTIEAQLQMPDVLPVTKSRCHAMINAIRDQAADILSILKPVLGDVEVEAATGSLPAPLQYIHYLYRDWGWPADPDGENERILASIDKVVDSESLGRFLVVGAGACRLAYDLSRRDPNADTTVLDIDPFLFAAAHTVIRGGSLKLREANAEIDETRNVIKEWMLSAPHGSLNENRFHFILADGLNPPFAEETFDTLLTPWFIDVVPSDLRDFVSKAYTLLKPGGRWLNIGPLSYRPDVSASRRFAREEVFELAERAGFRLDKSCTESMPYLVSKLNGRGKVERILAFAATKLNSLERKPVPGPPAWLVFRHIPIPTFSDQSLFWSEDPAVQMVVSAIDGRNTLDDIASLIAVEASETGLTMDQFREIVRRCLSESHPALRLLP